jgi:hypothetical protein
MSMQQTVMGEGSGIAYYALALVIRGQGHQLHMHSHICNTVKLFCYGSYKCHSENNVQIGTACKNIRVVLSY